MLEGQLLAESIFRVPLEDGGACNLGSLNLSRFVIDGYQNNARINWDQLAESSQLLIPF